MQNSAQLFIPTKCKVGFNLREDCYTKKLGYIIGWSGKKWRKEPSWESWRQKVGQKIGGSDYVDGKWVAKEGVFGEEVTPIEFENVPTSGFVLNKKAGGYKTDWNTRRTVCRIHDPRGFEFEIDIVNLLYILEHSNCMRGKGLEGEFVYSYHGKDLVLLPCCAPEYDKSSNYTALQSEKILAKSLIAGHSYKTKKEEDYIYVGRYMWYERKHKTNSREGKKSHIFWQPKQIIKVKDEDGEFQEEIGGDFHVKNDAGFLALKTSEEPVSDFAKIIDKFKANPASSDIVKWELIPTVVSTELEKKPYSHSPDSLKKYSYFKQNGDIITQYYVTIDYKYNKEQEFAGYTVDTSKYVDIKTKKLEYGNHSYYRGYNYNNYDNYDKKNYLQEKDLQNLGYCDLYITLESGKRIKINELTDI